MTEVTLIFPPTFVIRKAIEEELINELKIKAYNYWLLYLGKKFESLPELHRVFPSRGEKPMSLGLLCLSSYLKERGIKVKYVHCDYWISKKNLTWNSLLNFIEKECSSSNVCGIYSTTPTIAHALRILRKIKEGNPSLVTVLGGPHATFQDIEIIKEHPYVDFVVRGEGEKTLHDIVIESARHSKDEMKIPGATYLRNGLIMRGPDRPFLSELEIPSPDFEILPKDYELDVYDVYSRGCPFHCNFCVESKIWKHSLRFRNPTIVAEEFALIKREFKKSLIHIADSEIDISPKKLNLLLDAIEKNGINIQFSVNLRPDAFKRLNLKIIRRMNDLGFVGYFVGIESGSDQMLSRMGKDSTYSDFLKTLELLNQSGAKIVIPYLMLGFPGETEDTLSETQDKFIKLLEDDKVSFFFPKIFIPYPGTAPNENPELFSIDLSKDWNEYSRFGFPPPFSSAVLSNDALRTSIVKFYNRIIDVLKRKVV